MHRWRRRTQTLDRWREISNEVKLISGSVWAPTCRPRCAIFRAAEHLHATLVSDRLRRRSESPCSSGSTPPDGDPLEALSCGTPMLAANAQGFAEHLSHGVSARLWAPHDEASFDRELRALMETPRTGSAV